MVLRHVEDDVPNPGIYHVVGRDGIVQSCLKLASCRVADVFPVVRDVGGAVANDLRGAGGAPPNLAERNL